MTIVYYISAVNTIEAVIIMLMQNNDLTSHNYNITLFEGLGNVFMHRGKG